MSSKTPIEKIGNVSTQSVFKHTGKHWAQWVPILEKAGAHTWSHQAIVAFLSKKHKLSLWWQQIVATGYEVHFGRRVAGRDAKGEYSVTGTKTFYIDKKALWKLVTSPEGLAIWLAPMSDFKLKTKTFFEREDGVYGEIRTMKAGERIRFSWQEGDWAKTTSVLLFIVGRANGTSILVFQHERLKDGRLREPLRELWRKVLQDLHALTPSKQIKKKKS
ncbi:SRPBCC family protein [Bdellovibrio sp. HCB337]|uniref:SRPBCC family protein n=1 Tax=Bdellovibrio sp. HCB337 TaxID=3394358 RepID=UPI0039A534D1